MTSSSTPGSSYINYATFLSPNFSTPAYANALVTSTNDTSTTTTTNTTPPDLDLATPLSRALFDAQEVDTHIHALTTRAALPLLSHTHDSAAAGARIADTVDARVAALTAAHARLDRDVVGRWRTAETVRRAATAACDAVELARAVGRCLALGRQLEGQMLELAGRAPTGGSGNGSGSAGGGGASGLTSLSPSSPPPPPPLSPLSSPGGAKEDHRALVRAAHTLVLLRRMFDGSESGGGSEGGGGSGGSRNNSGGGGGRERDGNSGGNALARVKVIRTLRADLVVPAESSVRARAQAAVSRFALSALAPDAGGSGALGSGGDNGAGAQRAGTPQSTSASTSTSTSVSATTTTTFAQAEEARSRLWSALAALYLLSPLPPSPTTVAAADFRPELLLASLQGYVHSSLEAALAALTRGLTLLPQLERALGEVTARCVNVVMLEAVLATTRPPVHPFLSYREVGTETETETVLADGVQADRRDQPTNNYSNISNSNKNKNTILTPLLQTLDTSSLASYFWRSLASALASRVHDILSRGGVSARTLRSNRERVRDGVRACVLAAAQLPVPLPPGAAARSSSSWGAGGRGGGASGGDTAAGVGVGRGKGRTGTTAAAAATAVGAAAGSAGWEREAAVMASALGR